MAGGKNNKKKIPAPKNTSDHVIDWNNLLNTEEPEEEDTALCDIMRRKPKSYMMTQNLHPEYCQSPNLKPT